MRLRVPAPLIRVREGTAVVVSIRNDLDVTAQRARPVRARWPTVRAGRRASGRQQARSASRSIAPARITTGRRRPGCRSPFRGASDTQLSGALVVDPAAGSDRGRSRARHHRVDEPDARAAEDYRRAPTILASSSAALNPRLTFLINGLSWPATERLTYRVGERVRWRVINLSSQRHPMHMHGFYYEVDSLGDGLRETTYRRTASKQRVVTQLMQPGSTMAMTWTPERAGNWLFHCHIMHHVSPDRRLTESADAARRSSCDARCRRQGWRG